MRFKFEVTSLKFVFINLNICYYFDDLFYFCLSKHTVGDIKDCNKSCYVVGSNSLIYYYIVCKYLFCECLFL